MATTAIVPLGTARRFRIGPEHHGYNYKEYPGITVNGSPVYQCEKGRDGDPNLLYLHYSQQTGSWLAVSVAAAAPSEQDILAGAPAFRAQQDVDVREPGFHNWCCYNNAASDWYSASPFLTTAL